MALNFPVDQWTLGFTPPNWLGNPNLMYMPPSDSNQGDPAYNNKGLTVRQRAGIDPIPGGNPYDQPPSGFTPQGGSFLPVANQQPSTPIRSPQGSPPQQVASPNPPRLQSAPNSPALIGGSPNMALTNGSGYPMGGLPTQSPMTELYQFNQMQNAQPLINGQPDLARMQRQAQNLQNFKQLLARLGGYSFQG